MRDDVQRMKRIHSVCFCENALVCAPADITGNRDISPGKCRCELVLRAGARVCVVMSVLRRAETRQCVAGVVRIGMPGFALAMLPLFFEVSFVEETNLLSGFIPKPFFSLAATQDIPCQPFPAIEVPGSFIRRPSWLHAV